MFPGSACEYNCYLPSTVGHLIIADFLFPKASGSIHSSQLQRRDLTHPYALAFILKPCLPLSWRPPSVPREHICSDFGHPLASWLRPRNPPALEVEVGVPPAPAVFPRQLQSADGGAALACFLSGHFLPRWDWGYLEGQDPIPGGAEEAAASPFPTLGNASHPFHPTPGQLPRVRLRVEGGGGAW